jgi:hypothetical protein
VPAGLITLGHHDVHAGLDVVAGVPGLPGQHRHQHAALVGAVDDIGRRGAERVRDQPGRVVERHLDLLPGHRVQPAEHAVAGRGAIGQRRHAELDQRVLDELPVRGQDQAAQVAGRALGGPAGGHDDIDAIRPAIGVGVHPPQHGVQAGRVVEADAAEHAQAAGPADRGGDVLGRVKPMMGCSMPSSPHSGVRTAILTLPAGPRAAAGWLAAYCCAHP